MARHARRMITMRRRGGVCGNIIGNPTAVLSTAGWTTFINNTIERVDDFDAEGLSLTGLPPGVTTGFKCTYVAPGHPACLRSTSAVFPELAQNNTYRGSMYVWVPSTTTGAAQVTTINFSDGSRTTPVTTLNDQWERVITERDTGLDTTGDFTADWSGAVDGDVIYIAATSFGAGTTCRDFCDNTEYD